MSLKPYQKEAVKVIQKSHQLLLADEMGLGKTATMLFGIKHHLEKNRRFLVVCPASLKLNWCNEIKKWLGIDIVPDNYCGGLITVTNYERLKYAKEWCKRGMYHGIVFDECHYLKGRYSQRHILAKECTSFSRKVFMLSGTPMLSGPSDLAPQLDIMNLLCKFGGYDKFYKKYCSPVFSGWGWDYSGASNQRELKELLSSYMIRRTKDECGICLPRKQIIDIPIAEIKQPFATTFKEMEEQQKKVNEEKFPMAIDFINNLLYNGKRPVIFVHHRDLLFKIFEQYKDIAVGIYGGQDMYKREEAVRKFQDKEKAVIVCSLQASATGITLTSSDTAVFLEYLWSPSVSKQAQDRIHRITQDRDVTIYNLYCKDSIEMQKGIRRFVKELDMEGIL
jgi:SWI/SNF-related matrix-associated actin-dependent regulator 1 of chromatin subfamily A